MAIGDNIGDTKTDDSKIADVASLNLPVAESKTLPAIVANKAELKKIRSQISLADRASIATFGDRA